MLSYKLELSILFHSTTLVLVYQNKDGESFLERLRHPHLSSWIQTLQKHVKNFEDSTETWKKVVKNTPFEIIKQLVLTVKQFQHSTHYEPLHYAAISGNLGLYKYIHEKMEEKIPQTGSKGWTPLHFAVKHGQIEVIEFIVANVTDKNPGDKSGMTPLLIAAAQVNFSRMSTKLVRTYPRIVENRGITMDPLFLRLLS